MHQDDRRARRGSDLRRARVVGQGGHVVYHPRARLERRRHDVSLAGVGGNRGSTRGELADDRHDALDLIAFPDDTSAGTSRLPAHIDDRRAFARHVGAGRGRRARVGELSAVGEAVGSGVDDSHHLRLVEANGALAQLQRGSRRGQRLPLRRQVVVEAAFDALDRNQLGRSPPLALNRDQFDRDEPVQSAGEPRGFSIMIEGRIDEGGWTDKRAHAVIASIPQAAGQPARWASWARAHRARRASRRSRRRC